MLVYSQSGGEGGAFLKNGFGARPNAMGNAFSGVANDVSAVFYNPAGLFQISSSEGLFMYSKLFNDVDGLTYGNIAIAQPFNFGTLALATVYMKTGDIPYVSSPSGPDGSVFSDNQVIVSGSYSNIIHNFLMFGGTLKFVNHTVADYGGSGFGMDFGLLAKFNKYFSAGVLFENFIQPRINLNNSEYLYPFKARIGSGIYPVDNLIISAEIDVSKNKNVIFCAGSEYTLFQNLLSLRAGYSTLNSSISFGAGVFYKGVGFDYSVNSHKELGNVNKF